MKQVFLGRPVIRHSPARVGSKAEAKKLAKGRKFHKVMDEFGGGTLHHGGTGEVVTDPAVAKAIAFSEQRRVKKKKRK